MDAIYGSPTTAATRAARRTAASNFRPVANSRPVALPLMERCSIVFTDGAAKGNPGPGGWGAIVVTPEQHVTELGGGSPHTTNNKMELSGAISGLERVADHPDPVAIYTDSTYVIQGITQWV